ncbi:MAG: replicative DNA helicase, partial [bacterium]
MLNEVSSYLYERDFYDERNRLIYRAINELSQRGVAVDIVSVIAVLREKRALTRAGGAAYVSSLIDDAPDIANVKFYADEIKKVSLSRDLHRVGKILQQSNDPPRERLDKAFATLAELSNTSIASKEAAIGDISKDILARVLDGNGVSEGIKTGFSELDRSLWGLCPSDLIILAARPSVGKSAFTLQVAANVAKRNHPVLYISPEMSEEQLGRRLLSLESGVSYQRILKSKYISRANSDALREAHDRIRTLPLVIDDSSRQSLQDVRIKARRMHARMGLDLLVVDYLQLLATGDDSKEEVTMISKGLKSIAKDLEIPVWAVSQLSRGITMRESKRPELQDLRGSGQLEQDADV